MSRLLHVADRVRRYKRGEPFEKVYADFNDRERAHDLDRESLVDGYLSEHPADDSEPLSIAWLLSIGFQEKSLCMSKLLTPDREDACIVELTLTPMGEIPHGGGLPAGTEWSAGLLQSDPEDQHGWGDHVVITSLMYETRGQLRRLLEGLTACFAKAERSGK